MALSDLAVRRAKATGKDYTLPDTLGLSLAVAATGGKTWHFRYYWLKEPKRMSFGTYPEVSLLEARALRDEARAFVARLSVGELTDLRGIQERLPMGAGSHPSRRQEFMGARITEMAELREAGCVAFGQGNAEPTFAIRGLRLRQIDVFKEVHFRFQAEDTRGRRISGVAWKMAQHLPPSGEPLELAAQAYGLAVRPVAELAGASRVVLGRVGVAGTDVTIDAQVLQYRGLCARRVTGEPIAYITGILTLVVLAGWLIRVRVSPMLTRWLMNCDASMKRSPPLAPPLTPKASSELAPLFRTLARNH